MKPLPSESAKPEAPALRPEIPLTPRDRRHAATNRRSGFFTTQRIYPVLLIASTAMAAVFCMLYITKPVIAAHAEAPSGSPQDVDVAAERATPAVEPAKASPVMIDHEDAALPVSAAADGREETNLRI